MRHYSYDFIIPRTTKLSLVISLFLSAIFFKKLGSTFPIQNMIAAESYYCFTSNFSSNAYSVEVNPHQVNQIDSFQL